MRLLCDGGVLFALTDCCTLYLSDLELISMAIRIICLFIMRMTGCNRDWSSSNLYETQIYKLKQIKLQNKKKEREKEFIQEYSTTSCTVSVFHCILLMDSGGHPFVVMGEEGAMQSICRINSVTAVTC